MKNKLFLTTLALTTPLLNHGECMQQEHLKKENSFGITEATPAVLYKIVSLENWEKSQGKASLVLAPEDDAFIHFSKEDQFQKVVAKVNDGGERDGRGAEV